jgi:Flp pilus assembly protein TadD
MSFHLQRPSCGLLFLLLTACSSGIPPHFAQQGESIYLDQRFPFAQSLSIESSEDIFMVDDTMKALVRDEIKTIRDPYYKAQALLEALFGQDSIKVDYSATANLTARQAFYQRTANCLSLTILAYVLADEAKLDVDFQQVDIPEYWFQQGSYSLLSGHVNLVVNGDFISGKQIIYGGKGLEIDFDPFAIKKHFDKRIISRSHVQAMFYNNKGAQALIAQDYDLAYRYFKAATLQAGNFSSPWTNLGYLYRLKGFELAAEKSYRHAISLNNNDLTALTNLAVLYHQQGNSAAATEIDSYLEMKRSDNPYYQFLLGNEAYVKGSYQAAIAFYKKALKMDANIDEFYFAMAKAYFQLGQYSKTRRYLNQAIKASQFDDVEALYVAKLQVLKEYQ